MMLEAKNIAKSYMDRSILRGVSVSFSKGEVVGILGPNGAGKTTLFSILIGMIQPEAGTIAINGLDITKTKMCQRSKMGIVYLPQDSSIFRGLSVEDNIKAILQIRIKNKEILMHKLEELLDSFSLIHLRRAMSVSLSGGERRKVEIARALASDPEFLLLDEPFSGIDPISIFEITGIIEKLKEKGIGVIITDHNVRETLNVIDKGYIIANGSVLISGNRDDIMKNAETRKIYLGEKFRI